MTDLTPQHVLADLLGSADFPAEVLDPDAAAAIIIQRLIDAGFVIKEQEDQGEIERLKAVNRRAKALADERAIEAVELRIENERLKAKLAELQRKEET